MKFLVIIAVLVFASFVTTPARERQPTENVVCAATVSARDFASFDFAASKLAIETAQRPQNGVVFATRADSAILPGGVAQWDFG